MELKAIVAQLALALPNHAPVSNLLRWICLLLQTACATLIRPRTLPGKSFGVGFPHLGDLLRMAGSIELLRELFGNAGQRGIAQQFG
jgi:hypothetical protein